MNHQQMGSVVQHLRRAAALQQEVELSDGQLLERFTRRRDESAFEVLVRRHGPMVLGVCRGILRQQHDADDAFQATFLILAQKAVSIRRGNSVSGWLHEVAYNVSLKAQIKAARRQTRYRSMPDRAATEPLDDLTVRELRQALHEELRQLPQRYRAPLLLCYFEGRTQEEAARQLDWPLRRVKGRLQRGREQLRRRLLKRGLAPVATLGTAFFAADGALAAVPTELTAVAMRTVMRMERIDPTVAALVDAASTFVFASKAKAATVLLLIFSLLGGVGVSFVAGPLHPQEQPLHVLQVADGTSATPRTTKREPPKTVEIQGRVLGTDGKPKAGAKLFLFDRKGHIEPLGVTAADGRFTVAVSNSATKRWGHWLIAQASGSALDFLELDHFKGGQPVELRLAKDHPIRGRVVNTEGKPLRGMRVAVRIIEDPIATSLDSFLIAWKKRSFGSSIGSKKSLFMEENEPLATTTDADGRFVLDGAGTERIVSLHFSGAGMAEESRYIVNRAGFDPEPYNQAARDKIPKGEKPYAEWFLHGPNVLVVAEAEKPICGMVTDADTGLPAPGVRLHCFNQKAKSDAEGRYQIHGVHKRKSYSIGIPSDPATGFMASEVRVDDTAGYQSLRKDLRIKKGVIITGKVIDPTTGRAVPGYAAAASLANNPFVKGYPDLSSDSLRGEREYTERDGAFRIVTIPGPVLLMVNFDYTQSTGNFLESMKYADPIPDPEYPHYFQKTPHWLHYLAFGGGTSSVQGNFCKVLEIKPGTRVVHQDAALRRASGLPVAIEDAEGRPLHGCWATGIGTLGHPPVRIDEASCSAYDLKKGERRFMVFYHPDKKLAGTLVLAGNEKQPATVKLRPMGSVKGRLLDPDRKPLAGVAVDLRYRESGAYGIQQHIHWEKQDATDAAGAFTLDEVVPELQFRLSFQRRKHRFERGTKPADPYVQVKSGECLDLGVIRLKQLPDKDD